MFELVHEALPFRTRFNEGQRYSRNNLNIGQLIALPILSGIGASAGSPFELVEFRKHVAAPKQFQPDPFKGTTFELFNKLREKERSLFLRATRASAFGTGGAFAATIFAYEGVWSLCFSEDRNWFPLKSMIASFIGSTTAVIVTNPLHLSKTSVFVPQRSSLGIGVSIYQPAWDDLVSGAQYTAEESRKKLERVEMKETIIDEEARKAFRNVSFKNAIRWLWDVYGNMLFIRGVGLRLFEFVPLMTTHLTLFESVKFFKGTVGNDQLSFPSVVMTAGCSTAIPHVILYPMILIKNCMAAQHIGYYNYTLNFHERVHRLMAQGGGLPGLYRGFRTAALRYNLTVGLGLIGYEYSRRFLVYLRGPKVPEDDDVWEL